MERLDCGLVQIGHALSCPCSSWNSKRCCLSYRREREKLRETRRLNENNRRDVVRTQPDLASSRHVVESQHHELTQSLVGVLATVLRNDLVDEVDADVVQSN